MIGITISNPDPKQPVGPLADRLRALSRLLGFPSREHDVWGKAGLDDAAVQAMEEDDWAAIHYRVLTHDLLPAAGVFLEERGMLGGAVSRFVQDGMIRNGYTPDIAGLSPDHVAHELAYLAHLLDGKMDTELALFWWGHGAGWIPLLPAMWTDSEEPGFVQLAKGLEQAISALDDRIPRPGIDQAAGDHPMHLADPRMDLDDERVGLAQIGTFLAVPARSGLLLTRTWMSRAGRRFRLPTGFGSRMQVAEGLLRSAVHYEAFDDICGMLESAIHAQQGRWAERRDHGDPFWARRWMERLSFTESVLERMRMEAGRPEPE